MELSTDDLDYCRRRAYLQYVRLVGRVPLETCADTCRDGLVRAWTSFDATRSDWRTWRYVCIYHALREMRRVAYREQGMRVALRQTFPHRPRHVDVRQRPAPLQQVEDQHDLARFVHYLQSRRQRRAADGALVARRLMALAAGQTQAEIARADGVTEGAVSLTVHTIRHHWKRWATIPTVGVLLCLLLGPWARVQAAQLCAFTWDLPTTNTDGSPLTDLQATVLYGAPKVGQPFTRVAEVLAPLATHTLLCVAGELYLVRARNSVGLESADSNQVKIPKSHGRPREAGVSAASTAPLGPRGGGLQVRIFHDPASEAVEDALALHVKPGLDIVVVIDTALALVWRIYQDHLGGETVLSREVEDAVEQFLRDYTEIENPEHGQ